MPPIIKRLLVPLDAQRKFITPRRLCCGGTPAPLSPA